MAAPPDRAGGRSRRTGLCAPALAIAVGLVNVLGCHSREGEIGRLEAVWGARGLMPGQLIKPRAIAITPDRRIYLVDMRAMIQGFTPDGEYVVGWESPCHEFGRPSGLAVDLDGNILVADSHYHQILKYSPSGELLWRIGGEREFVPERTPPPSMGEFGYIGDVAVDSTSAIYVAESQQFERITKLSPDGLILRRWGGRGIEPGQFQRPRALAFDKEDRLYVADACNHRIQVFDGDGRLLRIIGEPGSGQGQLSYPYDVAIAPDQSLYVCEYGNNRVQRFSPAGASMGTWGSGGREKGRLWNPWALAVDDRGLVYVVDSNNHRVQRVRFD
jgi:DNA-binding beta-propeller fold protein YncE